MTVQHEGILVDKHNLLGGIGPNSSDVWICIQALDDWRTCQYDRTLDKCPLCGDKLK